MHPASSVCPACGAARAPGATVCAACGLIFASHQPGSAAPPVSFAPARCPRCARPLQPGAIGCAACAAAEVFVPLRPGQLLARDRYTVLRPLARGGMGAIYLAADREAFDRTVVVKAMLDYFDPSDPAQVQEARDRFVQEARTLSTLRHPAIPQIIAYFQDGSRNYIVMEYIEGQDLEQELTRPDETTGAPIPGKPYPRREVLRWGIAVCRVLEYLASRTPQPVVHHDIKPANLVLDSSSNDICLVDFGTAKARLLVQSQAVGLRQSSIYGTHGYAAPEQYDGESEPRSDVYALAATLYHLATDDDPRAHPFTFPRLGELDQLGWVLAPALDRDITLRPAATTLRQQLEALLSESTHPIQSPNGTDLADQQALVGWCEQHWEAAIDWLYGPLPEQIQMFWGQTSIAAKLREIILRHRSEPDAGLDAALALLDPHGFGAAQPELNAAPKVLNYGLVGQNGNAFGRELIVSNIGRRYVQVQILLPFWLECPISELHLAPGQQERLLLVANEARLALPLTVREEIRLERAGQTLLHVGVRATKKSSFSGTVNTPQILFVILLLAICIAPGTLNNRNPRRSDWRPAPTAVIMRPTLVQPTPWQIIRFEQTMTLHTTAVEHIAFTIDGQILASAGADSIIRLWRVSDGILLYPLVEHVGVVESLAFSPDGQIIASGGQDKTIKLWRVRDGRPLGTLDGHTDTVRAVTFSPDGQLLASGGADGTIRVWRASDSTLLYTLTGYVSHASSIAFSPDSQSLAMVGQDQLVHLRRTNDGTLIRTIATLGEVTSLAFQPGGSLLAVGTTPIGIELWRMMDNVPVRTFQVSYGIVRGLAWSPDGEILASSDSDDMLLLWLISESPADGQINMSLWSRTIGKDAQIRSVAWNGNEQLASAGGDGKIVFWRVK